MDPPPDHDAGNGGIVEMQSLVAGGNSDGGGSSSSLRPPQDFGITIHKSSGKVPSSSSWCHRGRGRAAKALAGTDATFRRRVWMLLICVMGIAGLAMFFVMLDATGEGENMDSGDAGSDFLFSFLAGGISGTVAKTCTAPIERVKLLIQTQDANPKIISGEVMRYTGIVDCFTRVAKEQGIGAFWRGNLANIIRYFPTQAFNFAFKDTIKGMFPKANKKTEFGKFFMINMASGGLAGAGSLMITYPLDYARTRLASDVGSGLQQFNGLIDCIQKTVASSGIAGLYNGIGVSIAGIIPYRGVYFGLFDTLSGINPFEKDENNLKRAASKFLCAQTSAITAAYASYPMDTVRRRLQMQSELPPVEWIYKGTLDCFRKIMKDEGTSALFKGAGANALRTVGAAMVLVLYSEITAAFGSEK